MFAHCNMAKLLKYSQLIAIIGLTFWFPRIVLAEQQVVVVGASSSSRPPAEEADDHYDDYDNGNSTVDYEVDDKQTGATIEMLVNKVTFGNISTVSTLRLNESARIIRTNMNTIILNNGTAEMLLLEIASAGSAATLTHRSIGRLDNVDDEAIVDIQAIVWNEYTLFVVALTSRYNVYLAKSEGDNGVMVPIERIALHGVHQKVVLFAHGGEVFGLIGNVVRSGELSSTIRLYKWRQSHFTLLETKNTNTFSNIMTCASDDAFIVAVIKNDFTDMVTSSGNNQQKRLTLVQVHTFADDRLRHIQNMFVYAIATHLVRLQRQCLLLAVTERTAEVGTVESFVWEYDYLKKFRDHHTLWIDQLTDDGGEMIVVQQKNRLVAYTQSALVKDYPIDLAAGGLISSNRTRMVLMKSHGREFLFMLLLSQEKSAKETDDLRICCVEVHLEAIDAVGAEPVWLADKCYTDLQAALQARQRHVDRLKSEIEGVLRKDQPNNLAGTSVTTIANVIVHRGNFSRVRIDAAIEIGAKELLTKIEILKHRLNKATQGIRASRRRRDLINNATTDVEVVNVKHLNISSDMFKNVLLKSKVIQFDKKISTDTMTVKQMKMSSPALRNSVATNNVVHLQAKSIPRVRQLNVKTINGIAWDDFYHATYQLGSNVSIKGNLVLSQPSHLNSVELRHINKMPVESFFTLATPQTIAADMYISRFFTKNIVSRLVNDIDFGGNVAKSAENTTIHGPVKILNCTIDKLTLSENERNDFARHIVGTQQEDLSQIYNGRVTIKGSLKLHRVTVEQPNRTQIFVNGQLFGLNMANQYWMKSIDQHFDAVRFENAIITPQIHTDTINELVAATCVLTNQNPTTNISWFIHTARIHGNVYTDPTFITTVSSINEHCIRRTDTAIVTGGCKRFSGHLTIDELQCQHMDDTDLGALVRNKPNVTTPYDFDCVKQFQRIHVDGDVRVESDTINIGHLNGNDLLVFAKNYVRIDGTVTLAALRFAGNVKVGNVTLTKINESDLSEVMQAIEATVGANGTIQSVRVVGDVVFNGELFADTVNGIVFNDYLSTVVTRNSENLLITGTKQFKALQVQQLNVPRIGSVDLNEWFANALHTRRSQIVAVPWTMDVVQAQQLDVVAVNGVATQELLDDSQSLLEISSDLTIDSVIVRNSIRAQLPCDVISIENSLANGLADKRWHTMEVDGEVRWPVTDRSTVINKLIEFAVTDTSDQIISGDITFVNRVIVQTANTEHTINNINIVALRTDALMKNAEFQHVAATKRFVNSISIGNLITDNSLNVPVINSVDILRLDRSMFRINRDTLVTGTKTFKRAPWLYQLNIHGTINGIESVGIVSASSSQPMPSIQFNSVVYIEGDLSVGGLISDQPLDKLMAKRVRLNGAPQELSGLVTFQNLVIKGDAQLAQINDVYIEDVVVRSSDALQTITGHKRVNGNVTIDGPALLGHINGIDVVQAYTNTIFLDGSARLAAVEVCGNVHTQRGFEVLHHLNGIAVNSLTHWRPPTARDMEPITDIVTSTLASAHSVMQQTDTTTSSNIRYLDYATNIRIKYEFNPSVTPSFTVDTTGSCDERCSCPAQNDVSITATSQIFIHRRPNFERIIKIKGRACNITILTSFLTDGCAPTNATQSTTIMWHMPQTTTRSIRLSVPSIRGARLFEQDNTSLLLLNHHNGTIAVMKMDANATEWKYIGHVGMADQRHHLMEVLSWDNYNILLVFTVATPGHPEMHGTAGMHYFDGNQFQPLHGEIPGDYDRCAVSYMRTRNEYMIWLTRVGTDVLTIFKAVYQAQMLQRFALLQKIVMDGMVANIVPLDVDDFNYIVVVTQNDHLYLYKYNYLEGWIATAQGYFVGVETVVPFKLAGQDYLFVSMKSASTALVIYRQGVL